MCSTVRVFQALGQNRTDTDRIFYVNDQCRIDVALQRFTATFHPNDKI